MSRHASDIAARVPGQRRQGCGRRVGRRRLSRHRARRRCSAPTAPSNRINVGAIGTGRISRGHDLPGLWKHDDGADHGRLRSRQQARRGRQDAGQRPLHQDRPASRTTASPATPTTASCSPTRTSTPSSSARPITGTRSSPSTPCEAGKDVYLQKPASLTIAEGRALSNAVHRSGRIFQIGSQQRSSPQFRYAAELVRNGRIGQLKTVEVGLPGDPVGRRRAGDAGARRTSNYDMWLGSTPVVPYTEKRVHPQNGYGRPGLAALRAVRRRHDHRLGRAPHRQRALGHGHRVHRPDRDLGHGGVPDEGPVGRPRRRSRPRRSTPTACT